jgi:hypothetical protein
MPRTSSAARSSGVALGHHALHCLVLRLTKVELLRIRMVGRRYRTVVNRATAAETYGEDGGARFDLSIGNEAQRSALLSSGLAHTAVTWHVRNEADGLRVRLHDAVALLQSAANEQRRYSSLHLTVVHDDDDDLRRR